MSRRSRWEVVRGQLRVPLLRNAYSLVGSSIATSGLGMVFWIVAARAYSKADVGLGAALISTMVILSNLAQLNLTTAFNRFVPTAGRSTRRLVLIGYVVTVALAAVAAIVFIVGCRLGVWAPKLGSLLDRRSDAVWFVLANMVWTVFVLEDAVLTGLGETHWVLVENTVYGLLKLAVLLAVASRFPHSGIFVAWTLPLILCVIAVNRLVLVRIIPARAGPPLESVDARAIGRFVSADYVSSLLTTAANGLIPLLVLGVLGKVATAYVYLAYTISYTLTLISLNVGMSMITEVARAPDRLVEYARKTVALSLKIVVPLALGLAVAAPWVLRVFGADYASNATRLLQLFALAAIPNVFTSTYLSIMRAKRAMSAVLIVTAVQSVSLLVLMSVLLRTSGLTGVGVAWVMVQTALGVFLLLGELRTLWLPFVHPGPLRTLAARARLATAGARPRRGVLRTGLETLAASGLAERGWEAEDFVAETHDICLLGLRSRDSGERAILKVATTEDGPEVLRQSCIALQAVRGCAPPQLSDLLPDVLETGETPAATWLLETRCRGVDGRSAAERADVLDPLLVDIVQRMGTLYRVGAASIVIDEEVFARLVDKPLAATAVLHTTRLRTLSDANSLAKVRAELHAELIGRDVTMSLTHGDLWLGNVLWEPGSGRVTGLVDWHCATVEQPVVDITHLLCTTRALAQHRELGAVVRDVLRAGSLSPRDEDLVGTVPGAGEISIRTAILLAWLRHISDNAVRTPRFRANHLWLEHNVHQVLESV